ncbi:MAG: type I restriction endonuclease subunit R [Gammaproteobacteria bacterium]|nr:type I restriction endonuclease subunit R [Gammaproteobacteria bacterium]MYF27524.1 type I restriction endonuclease subunit R [Gammaproteobacteria bacterium]
MTIVTESIVEDVALDWFRELGYQVIGGPEIGPAPTALRKSYADVVLDSPLRGALGELNPEIPKDALRDAQRNLLSPSGATLEARNRSFHRMVVDGVPVEYRSPAGALRGAQVRVIDFEKPEANTWLAVNQFTVTENQHTRRPDLVIFVNGLPLAVIELKNPIDETATVLSAYHQLQTYKAELPTLFAYNAVMAISDGMKALLGTLTAGSEWFKPWRTIDGQELAPVFYTELQVLIKGVFEKGRFLSLLRDFIVFEDDGGALAKKMAGYHQFHAVQTAVAETLRATELQQSLQTREERGRYESGRQAGGDAGDRRIGVVWHTQGSGKSLTMAFYAGRIIREPAMGNPTLVVLTDRNDLDDQLFGTFARCHELLRQPPVQAESREDLKAKLSVAQGGVVFTTIQKFFPEEKGDRYPLLSGRRNIVVIADEAHRSQYDFIDGYARHMRDALPNASFIGFTGTPIELQDANTRAVFGDYISVYDIQRAVEDGATVPIYYESRLAKLALDESARPSIDPDFEDATEGEEVERKERLKTRWAQLEAIVGAEQRLRLVAEDIVAHFNDRTEAMEGKAMVVCMSRRICVDLYDELIRLRPDWHEDDDVGGRIKVVMTGSASDPPEWQGHIRNKQRREALAKRFRDASDSFQIVLVRDMWLTGFDAPSLHTMYVDKPMRGHGLMQAIARVNRVFRDKPGGLVVDYLGLSHELKQALATYTESGGTGQTAVDKGEAIALMLEKHEVCLAMLHGFDFSAWVTGTPAERLALLPAAQEHILAREDGKDRFIAAVRDLTRAFALAVPSDEATRIRDDVGFFQAVQSVLAKRAATEDRPQEELDNAVRGIISRAVAPEGVIDIFAAAGLPKPDISILSEEFLAEVRGMEHRNLAVELLQKLLKGEVAARRRRNVVQARSFAEMLDVVIRRYQNRSVAATQVIEELIELAREIREAGERGEQLGLTDDELAFYDALETNDSAVQVLGDDTLCIIARELVRAVRANVTIDWTLRENVRANLRRLVKRILRKHGYPPDKQESATRMVIEQAEVLSAGWAN